MEHRVRCEVLAAVRGVDYVVPYENEPDWTVSAALRQIRPAVFVKGGDRTDRESIPEWDLCQDLGIRVVVPDEWRGVGMRGESRLSSSFFLQRWTARTP